MMKLLYSPASPYARKVTMTALIKGLDGGIEKLVADTMDPAKHGLGEANPLHKIPTLILEDGTGIFDSHVICEYLDSRVASPVLFPGEGPERWRMLTRAALADGILDAALLIVYEGRYRTEGQRVQAWVDRQQGKIAAALDHFEAHPPAFSGHPDYSHITLAAALGYVEFRIGAGWREGRPKLVAWLDDFAARVPAYGATIPR